MLQRQTMAMQAEKYLTIQFRLEEIQKKQDLDVILQTHPSKRKYHSKISTRIDSTDKVRLVLQEFAKRNKYQYEYFRTKNEFHIRVPGNYLTQNSIAKERTGSEESSNKDLNPDELSLTNFLGEVIYKMPHNFRPNTPENLSGSSFLKGFIRTTKEKRSFIYKREPINYADFNALEARIQSKFNLYRESNKSCIGIICLGDTTKITITPSVRDNLSFEESVDIQTIKLLSPGTKLIHYTGISVLSALKTAITDKVNRPDVLILHHGDSVFDYTETETNEIKKQLLKAASEGISVVSPYLLEHDNNFILGSTNNILHSLDLTLRCFVQYSTNNSTDSIPIHYQNSKYIVSLAQLNPVLWAIRIAWLNRKLGYRLGFFQNFIESMDIFTKGGNLFLSIDNKQIIGYNNPLLNSEPILINDLLECLRHKGGDHE